jgi:hypothetical protein
MNSTAKKVVNPPETHEPEFEFKPPSHYKPYKPPLNLTKPSLNETSDQLPEPIIEPGSVPNVTLPPEPPIIQSEPVVRPEDIDFKVKVMPDGSLVMKSLIEREQRTRDCKKRGMTCYTQQPKDSFSFDSLNLQSHSNSLDHLQRLNDLSRSDLEDEMVKNSKLLQELKSKQAT